MTLCRGATMASHGRKDEWCGLLNPQFANKKADDEGLICNPPASHTDGHTHARMNGLQETGVAYIFQKFRFNTSYKRPLEPLRYPHYPWYEDVFQ